MTTLGELTTELAELLSDPLNAVWEPEDLEQYLRAGVREISAALPRTCSASLACVAGEHELDMPADFQAALSVEYPAGETPPRYLLPGDRTAGAFWLQADRYQVIQCYDGGQVATLVLSASPAAGESVTLVYTADHDHTLYAHETLTVPERWHNLLLLFAVWLAWLERVSAEEQNPDRSTLMLSQHAENAERARMAYEEALALAVAQRAQAYITPAWKLDSDDPVI